MLWRWKRIWVCVCACGTWAKSRNGGAMEIFVCFQWFFVFHVTIIAKWNMQLTFEFTCYWQRTIECNGINFFFSSILSTADTNWYLLLHTTGNYCVLFFVFLSTSITDAVRVLIPSNIYSIFCWLQLFYVRFHRSVGIFIIQTRSLRFLSCGNKQKFISIYNSLGTCKHICYCICFVVNVFSFFSSFDCFFFVAIRMFVH